MPENHNIEIIELNGAAYHGGAWKVAYADFVTAMMAFFLLMWLLSMVPTDTLEEVASYFEPTPPQVSMSESGSGGVMGGLTMSPKGSMASNLQPIAPPPPQASEQKQSQDIEESPETNQESSSSGTSELEEAKELLRAEETEQFEQTKQIIEQAIQESPELAEMASNLMIDITPEGLSIQVIDQEGGGVMFPSGSAEMYQRMKELLAKITDVISPLPNKISVRGHTDSLPFTSKGKEYTNWELSSDRANASRRVIIESGLPETRVHDVEGKAATEPLLPKDPRNAKNRRITIVLLKEELTNPNFEKEAKKKASTTKKKEAEGNLTAPAQGNAQKKPEGKSSSKPDEGTKKKSSAPPPIEKRRFKKTPGNIEFP